jgi:hypothetical protein
MAILQQEHTAVDCHVVLGAGIVPVCEDGRHEGGAKVFMAREDTETPAGVHGPYAPYVRPQQAPVRFHDLE